MSDLELGSLGTTGVNLDLNPVDLPPHVLNNAYNLDFKGTHIAPMVQAVSRVSLPPNIGPIHYIGSVYVAGDVLCWLVCTETSAHLLYMQTWYNVTPANMLPSRDYQATTINGYLLLNNGRQKPFYVDIFDFLTPLKVYEVWPSDMICRVIASLEGILIGFGPQDSSGIFNKSLMIWSDIADPGLLPTNFAFDDPTSRAGVTTLEGAEFPITAVLLENRLQLYRTNSIYDIAYIGGNFVFSTTRRQLQSNLFSKNGVVAFRRSHFGIGDGSFFIFNGLDIQPAGLDVCADYFFKTVNREYPDQVRVFYDTKLDEIVIAYPEIGHEFCTKALIYDVNHQIWKVRVLDNVSAIAAGFFPGPSEQLAWNDLIPAWEDWDTAWKVPYKNSESSTMVLGQQTGLFKIPDNGLPMTAYGQRIYCAFDSQDVTGRVNNRRSAVKLLTELFPEVVGRCRFRVGVSDLPTANFQWTNWMDFDSSLNFKLDLSISGKYIAYEIDNSNPVEPTYFEMTGFALSVKNVGRY